MPKVIDLTKKKFGKLTVIAQTGRHRGLIAWLCKCDCGNTTTVIGNSLRSGQTKSCGCLQPITASLVNRKHGGKGTRLHVIWTGMRSRCSNPKERAYKWYGARGIRVCREWDRFAAFRDWAMANGYADNLTIDRIDNDGNYEPGNCRWLEAHKQSGNRRYVHRVLVNGVLVGRADACRILGLRYYTVRSRMQRLGQTIEQALRLSLRDDDAAMKACRERMEPDLAGAAEARGERDDGR